MRSPKSLNNTLEAFSRFIETGEASRCGWSPDFCKEVKADLAEIKAIIKDVNYYGGIQSLMSYAKLGAAQTPLFNDVEENVKR